MAVRPWHLLSLCDGYGGTELALRSVARVRTVCRVERDAYAAAVLVARMEESRLDQAPVWDDLCTFDGRPWRGRVDIVAAGFPCQPFSAAGKRAGTDDDRWLWPAIERIIADVRPRYVLVENVPQLVRHGLPEVLHGLASMGFNAEWGLLSATSVGAPHKRERLWIVADTASVGLCGGLARRSATEQSTVALCGSDVADPSSVDEREPHHQTRTVARGDTRPNARWRGFPPNPDDRDGWERWIAAGGPEPVTRRGADGPPVGLADALHLGGNGLVPQCAAEAWRQLADRCMT